MGNSLFKYGKGAEGDLVQVSKNLPPVRSVNFFFLGGGIVFLYIPVFVCK